GTWKLTLEVDDGGWANISVLVTTHQREKGSDPVRASVVMGVDASVGAPVIYADVSKGSDVVLGAQVVATVIRPHPPDVTVQLRDDGLAADAVKGDGTYTGVFLEFNGKGRYKALVQATLGADIKVTSRGPGLTPTVPQGTRPLFLFLNS
ncbi:unnamed protein product, partial [Ixodes hexagonus]